MRAEPPLRSSSATRPTMATWPRLFRRFGRTDSDAQEARIMAQQALTSHGFQLNTSADSFGELRPSNDILPDAGALRARIADEGYLLLRGLYDREVVLNARRELLAKMATTGEIDTTREADAAIPAGPQDWSSAFVRDLRTGPAIRAMCPPG